MVKTKDPAWSHFKASGDESKPWKDLYEGELHKGNITKMKLYLCFDSKLFRQQHGTAWLALMCTLTEGNMEGRAQKLKDEVAMAKAAHARAAEQPAGGSGPANASSAGAGAETSLAQRYGAFATSVAVSGFSAAQMAMEAKGQTFLTDFMDKSTKEEVAMLRQLQSRWMFAKGLPHNVCDGPEFADLLKALRPALAGKLLTRHIIRCVSSSHFFIPDGAHSAHAHCCRHDNIVAVTYNEVKAAVDEVKASVERFSAEFDGWTAPNKDYLINAVCVILGIPFFEFQPTPQGEKASASWTIEVLSELLTDTKCVGMNADNCSVMEDTKAQFLKLMEKNKRIGFLSNCHYHGLVSVCSALINAGGAVHTAGQVMKVTTGSADERWSADMRDASSLISSIKNIVKIFKLRQRPRGMVCGC